MINEITNNVKLSGEIVKELEFSHEVFEEKFYEFNIKVKRLSDSFDILPVIISEKNIKDIEIKNGNNVKVLGQYRSYNKVIDGKSKLILTVFVREISEEKTASNDNSIEIMGYLCKEPIYRTTPFNREICDILLAVNRGYNKSDYIPCIAWGKNARVLKEYKIGNRIKFIGRIQSREYQKKTENSILTKIAYEVSIGKIFIESKKLLDKDYENNIYNRLEISSIVV